MDYLMVNETTSGRCLEAGLYGDGFFHKVVSIFKENLGEGIHDLALFLTPVKKNDLLMFIERATYIDNIIDTYNPKVIIFFGTEYRKLTQKHFRNRNNILYVASCQYIFNSSGSVYMTILAQIRKEFTIATEKKGTTEEETGFDFQQLFFGD